ncbi:adenosylcobinamide-GDP ribazoletransferase [Alkalinema sp. FACHB-956]|nr:adenosylcobinamide-GDP ribazoletransferase [Alkalinema sp. FACHB-956]MBD2329868.1 adenosylcobinamide-GDP ribazoletransferase [Alkalinema sp. FACHB-956]
MLRGILPKFISAVTFYTCLPVPSHWPQDFRGIAQFAPWVGLGLGLGLGLLDWGLQGLHLPLLARSGLLVGAGLRLTGGLHLDGAMDTADGLAVMDPDRRLTVMADSRTGAFGAMVAVMILVLKILALSSLPTGRPMILALTLGWARWGQLWAIAAYPYLKAQGKGAFHKEAIQSRWQTVPNLLLLIALGGFLSVFHPAQSRLALGLTIAGPLTAYLTGAWLQHKLGGQTGDTYGAIVEWTEALLFCVATALG